MTNHSASLAEQFARRLLLMTLALEDALARECWHEVDQLFHRREELIGRLETFTLDNSALDIIQTVRIIDDRIADNLEKSRSLVSQKLQQNKIGRKAIKAYGTTSSVSVLDRAG